MFWYVVTLVIGIIIGSGLGAFTVYRKFTNDLEGIEILLGYYEDIVNQLMDNQKYLDSVAFKDQRAIRLMRSNASLLSQIRDDAEELNLDDEEME